eukprot:g1687.t1
MKFWESKRAADAYIVSKMAASSGAAKAILRFDSNGNELNIRRPKSMVGIFTHSVNARRTRSETEIELLEDGRFRFSQTIQRLDASGYEISKTFTFADLEDSESWSERIDSIGTVDIDDAPPSSCLLLDGTFRTQRTIRGQKMPSEMRKQCKEYPTFAAFKRRPPGEAWHSKSGLKLGYGPGFCVKETDKRSMKVQAADVRTKMLEEATDFQLAMLCCNNAATLGSGGEKDAPVLKKMLQSGNETLLHALGIQPKVARSKKIENEAKVVAKTKMRGHHLVLARSNTHEDEAKGLLTRNSQNINTYRF